MGNDYTEIVLRLASAVVVGGLIGIERSYHGRPAGFRTHTLVCMASALLMLVTVYESQWFVSGRLERVVVDSPGQEQGVGGIGERRDQDRRQCRLRTAQAACEPRRKEQVDGEEQGRIPDHHRQLGGMPADQGRQHHQHRRGRQIVDP